MEVFWLALALIVLLVLLRKPLHKALIGGLDRRAEKIRNDLDEAERLHNEAKELLEQQKRTLADGESRASAILAQAEDEAKRLDEKLRADFDAMVERRKQQADERIQQETARAVQDVRSQAASLAARTTRALIETKMGSGAANDAMSSAIAEVERKLG